MREMIKQNLAFERSEISAQEAKELFKSQSFKLELIEELSRDRQPIITYKTASPNQQSNVFIDLCAGPHINSAREINPEAFKLAKSPAPIGGEAKKSDAHAYLRRCF